MNILLCFLWLVAVKIISSEKIIEKPIIIVDPPPPTEQPKPKPLPSIIKELNF